MDRRWHADLMPCPICPGCEGPYPGPPRSGVTVQREEDVIADKRYYLNADRSQVVEEDDPGATYLLAAEGADISNEDVERYGLGGKKTKAPEPAVVYSSVAPPKDDEADVVDAPAEDDEAESKAVSSPPANKAGAPNRSRR